MKARTLTKNDVIFEIRLRPESRLARGDEWAWCVIYVECRAPGLDLVGKSAFREDAYFSDMCDEALRDLNAQLVERVEILEAFVEHPIGERAYVGRKIGEGS